MQHFPQLEASISGGTLVEPQPYESLHQPTYKQKDESSIEKVEDSLAEYDGGRTSPLHASPPRWYTENEQWRGGNESYGKFNDQIASSEFWANLFEFKIPGIFLFYENRR